MCSNHGSNQCRGVEVSLKTTMTTLKHVRNEAQALAEQTIAELREEGVDTKAAERLMSALHEMFDRHQERAENKLERSEDAGLIHKS